MFPKLQREERSGERKREREKENETEIERERRERGREKGVEGRRERESQCVYSQRGLL